jgi:hypothetical protein
MKGIEPDVPSVRAAVAYDLFVSAAAKLSTLDREELVWVRSRLSEAQSVNEPAYINQIFIDGMKACDGEIQVLKEIGR